ncbi:hypothetical protein QFC20_005290 [Naganishia adeliensis]|uniref:Uncharacterized protein n=1 Tax=Naganishia adeliensis TaxID=92952 RepID=A0ACC2VQT8_9TREE|nr:hypothetical protein QFC20_005290 [Naganishia adeliensis]
MSATSDDRELRRTARGTGARTTSQNSVSSSSAIDTKAKDTSPSAPVEDIVIKRSESDEAGLASQEDELAANEDEEEMEVDSVMPSEVEDNRIRGASDEAGEGDELQSEKENGEGEAARKSADTRDRSSDEQASGQWRDEAVNTSNTPAADDAHARKKRKVDAVEPSSTTSSATDKTASVLVGTPQTATQMPDARPPAQSGRLTRSPQATKATQVPQSAKVGQPGSARPAPGQGPSPARQSGQPPQLGRPPQSTQPSPRPPQAAQQPRPTAQASTSADDVVIADVDAAPSPKRTNGPPTGATPTTSTAAIDQNKKVLKRPPPLTNVPASGTGNGSAHPPSARSASMVEVEGVQTSLPSGLANVSPVVSGFPMQSADKATLESFRYALQIKDQQRELIKKRREGKIPPVLDVPGMGPPPSAGPIPPMMYLHKNSVGSRRSEAVKQKVQGMRVSTGTEGYRQNGMKTAPAGNQPQSVQGGPASSVRTAAHANVSDDGYDEDDAMQGDSPNIQPVPLRDGPSGYPGHQPSHALPPGSARYPPGYPRGPPGARPPPGEAGGAVYNGERRRSLNGYVQPGGPASARPPPGVHVRSPPYPPVSAYGQQTSPYQRPAKPADYPPQTGRSTSYQRPPPQHAMGGPPPSARGEYPPGTMYPPRPPANYPGGAPPTASGPGFRPRSPGRAAHAPTPVDVNKEHFMEPFHLLFDTFMDSMQLKRDLESKIRRANDLVEAQEAELRRISGLRMEFERSLDRLQRSQERVGQSSASTGGGQAMEASPPTSGGGSAAPPLARQESAGGGDREVAEMRAKLQQTERQAR